MPKEITKNPLAPPGSQDKIGCLFEAEIPPASVKNDISVLKKFIEAKSINKEQKKLLLKLIAEKKFLEKFNASTIVVDRTEMLFVTAPSDIALQTEFGTHYHLLQTLEIDNGKVACQPMSLYEFAKLYDSQRQQLVTQNCAFVDFMFMYKQAYYFPAILRDDDHIALEIIPVHQVFSGNIHIAISSKNYIEL